MTKIAIFGGSFDPPHVGHVLAVKYLLTIGIVDQVQIVPVFEHAFGKPLSDFEMRLRLVELAFLGEPNVEVSTVERELPRPNYTLHMVEAVAAQHPQASLRLVVGSDVLDDLHKWHRFDELVERAPLLVLGRQGFDRPEAPVAVLPRVSSSEIRELLHARNGSMGDPAVQALEMLLPKAVLDAIFEQDWYRAD